MRDAIVTVFFVKMDNRLRIAIGSEPVTTLFQTGAKFSVVIDLAVKNDPNVPVLIAHRLMPAGQIHDTQPAEAEGHLAGVKAPAIIWSAVTQDSRH
ncbi:MAG: hypothetical protein DMG37_22225 [Acidobacteria bacterium]|nr:MAG: hypothetical protein DMG37_22225 [Acidobacteriota bacterium]